MTLRKRLQNWKLNCKMTIPKYRKGDNVVCKITDESGIAYLYGTIIRIYFRDKNPYPYYEIEGEFYFVDDVVESHILGKCFN